MAVSRPGAELSGLNRGAVSIYLGLPDSGALGLSDADLTLTGDADSTELGTSLGAGFVDGDSFLDLLIGVPELDEGRILVLPAGPY